MRQVNVIFTRALRPGNPPDPASLVRHNELEPHPEQADRPVEGE